MQPSTGAWLVSPCGLDRRAPCNRKHVKRRLEQTAESREKVTHIVHGANLFHEGIEKVHSTKTTLYIDL